MTGSVRRQGFKDLERQVHPFGEIARISKTRYDPKSKQVSSRCIDLEHLEAGSGRLLGYCDAQGQDSIKAVFEPNDVLFGKLPPYLNTFYFTDFSGVCSTEIWVLKANQSICDPAYLACLVQTESFQKAVNVSSGSKMPRADWAFVRDATFPLPPIDEQRAIAKLLSCNDQIAHRYRSNLETLKIQRTALMQDLLIGKRRLTV
jgi:type I restriction enzyme S subunit